MAILRVLAVCALASGLWGCGGGVDEPQALKDYVQELKKFESMNREITSHIVQLSDPANEVTAEELTRVRKLIDDYVAKMQAIPEVPYDDLRRIHNLYGGSKLAEAQRLAADTGREVRRERGNVVIGVKHIEKMVRELYKNLDVLWLRQDITEAYPLKWPD